MHYIFFDCETGGLDPKKHSLLTAYFGIYDSDLKMIDDLYLQLKPENIADLNVQQEALDVTKINIDEHLSDPQTITYKEGAAKLLKFLEKNKIPKKRKSYMPSGHNIEFDKGFLFNQLVEKEDFEKTVHYRSIDTMHICNFLKDVDILPEDLGSLGSLVEHFNIPMREAHNAKDDIEMNVEVYRCIKKLMQTGKDNMLKNTISNIDLLKIIEI